MVAGVGAAPNRFSEVFVSPVAEFAARPLTNMGQQWKDFQIATREVVEWKSSDGTPIEGILKDFMEFGETGLADHEQSTPHQRAHAAERDAQLINRNGRSRRFSHASILPKTYRYGP